jgi:hypothetical protein
VTRQERIDAWAAQILIDCAVADWDGYGAAPVGLPAIEAMRKVLTELPEDAPWPTIGVDPDGAVCLDFHTSNEHCFSVSADKEGLIYAGRFSGKLFSGACSAYNPEDQRETMRDLLDRYKAGIGEEP